MKADGVVNRILSDIISSAHQPKSANKIKTTSVPPPSVNRVNMDPAASIKRVDEVATIVGKKLQNMSNLLTQIENEKNDIIREQLARFFNVLKAFIDEALHPKGDRSTDQIMSGKTIKLNMGADGDSIVVQGERVKVDNLKIRELSKLPTGDDIETMRQNIGEAQTSVRKLRNNLAAAISQIAHHSKESSAITL